MADEAEDEAAIGGPAGRGPVVVRPGECMETIAKRNGHMPQVLWDHPDNEALKSARQSLNVLLPGDRVAVPPVQPRWETAAVDNVHRFRVRNTHTKLRVALHDEGEPRANAPVVLYVDDRAVPGVSNTDGDGVVEARIRVGSQRAVLVVDDEDVHVLELRALNPASSVIGIQQRLRNLGYEPGALDDELGPRTAAALKALQLDAQREPTGIPDEATLSDLVDRHGS